MVRPDGGDKYITAGRRYEKTVIMTAENPNRPPAACIGSTHPHGIRPAGTLTVIKNPASRSACRIFYDGKGARRPDAVRVRAADTGGRGAVRVFGRHYHGLFITAAGCDIFVAAVGTHHDFHFAARLSPLPSGYPGNLPTLPLLLRNQSRRIVRV